MKKSLVLVWMLLIGIALQASENDSKVKDTGAPATLILSGSVVDENSGESLVGVEVKIAGTDRVAYTDFDGNFNFSNIKPGEYKLVTNYISYQQKEKELRINSKENNIKITLQTSN